MKEKLIELLMSAENNAEEQGFFNCHRSKAKAECIADYLLANGVILLPCKVGDDLYWINEESEVKCQKNAIAGIVVTNDGFEIIDTDNNRDKLGTRYAYLTHKEAEKALKEREDETKT